MRGTHLDPNKPAKAQSYRIYGGSSNNDGSNGNPTIPSDLTIRISKNGQAFANATNAPTAISGGSGGAFYLDLTAEEMDADEIFVSIDYVGSNPTLKGIDGRIIIRTAATSSGGLSLNDTVSNISNLPVASPTLGEAVSFLYQYFKKRRNRNSWSFTRHITRG